MDETRLRWKARIGSLKPYAFVVLLLGGFLLVALAGDLIAALASTSEPQPVSIEQLVTGTAGANRYVNVPGYAFYDAGYYEKTDTGQTAATYYLLLDPTTGHILVVKSPTTLQSNRAPEVVQLTGVVRNAPSELESAIREDLPSFSQEGFSTDPQLYLAEGDKPLSAPLALMAVLGLGGAMALAAVTFFFPSTAFAPKPLEALAATPLEAQKDPGTKATGRFQQLKTLEPKIEIGKRMQNFNNAVANITRISDGGLMIHIHHIVRTKLYGVVTVSKRESHWGAFISRSDPWEIEPGKLYGWRGRFGVRFLRKRQDKKPETLILSFDHCQAQADFVGLLRSMGFSVGTGIGY